MTGRTTQVDRARDPANRHLSGALIGKGEYRHFMQKEIFEQPTVIGDTLAILHQSLGRRPSNCRTSGSDLAQPCRGITISGLRYRLLSPPR